MHQVEKIRYFKSARANEEPLTKVRIKGSVRGASSNRTITTAKGNEMLALSRLVVPIKHYFNWDTRKTPLSEGRNSRNPGRFNWDTAFCATPVAF